MMIVLFGSSSYAQQTTNHNLQKENLFEKSKKQKKAALILLMGGGALFATGLLLPRGEYEGVELNPISGLSEKYSNDGIKGVCVLTGVLSMLGSVPLFMASSRNRKKAMAIALKNEMAPLLDNNNRVYTPVPSITVRLRL
jgi:hypothetical protein